MHAAYAHLQYLSTMTASMDHSNAKITSLRRHRWRNTWTPVRASRRVLYKKRRSEMWPSSHQILQLTMHSDMILSLFIATCMCVVCSAYTLHGTYSECRAKVATYRSGESRHIRTYIQIGRKSPHTNAIMGESRHIRMRS